MRLIDADKLKQHYAWWGEDTNVKKLFDEVVDAQKTVDPQVRSGTHEDINKLIELLDSRYCPQKDDFHRYDDYIDELAEYLVCHGVRVMEVEA